MATGTVNHIDREMAVSEAVALGDLVDWVTKAKDLIDEILMCARPSSKLHELLKLHNIAYGNADWLETEAAQGLAYVLQRQRMLIKSLA